MHLVHTNFVSRKHTNFMLWTRAKFWLGRTCPAKTLLLTTNAGKINPYPSALNILHRLWLHVFWCRFLAIQFLDGAGLVALLRRFDG